MCLVISPNRCCVFASLHMCFDLFWYIFIKTAAQWIGNTSENICRHFFWNYRPPNTYHRSKKHFRHPNLHFSPYPVIRGFHQKIIKIATTKTLRFDILEKCDLQWNLKHLWLSLWKQWLFDDSVYKIGCSMDFPEIKNMRS